MKREFKNYKIKRIHPRLFWHKCFICGNEFKNEDMWQIKSNTRGMSCVCTECAKTKEEIETYVKAGDGVPLTVPLKSSKDIPPAKTNRIPAPPKQYSHNSCGSIDNSRLNILLNNSKQRKEG